MSYLLLVSTGDPALDLLLNGGPVAILTSIIIAFWTGKLVPGGQVAKMEERHERELALLRGERDKYASFVQTSAEIAQRALEVTEKVKG